MNAALTREHLEQKLEVLKTAETQAHARFNAIIGARQFCEELLKELSVKEDCEPCEGSPVSNHTGE